jgi:hypothetical protein
MRLERLVVRAAGASLIVGSAAWVGGLISKNETLSFVAMIALGLGGAIACVPIAGFLLYSLYERLRR